MREGGGGGGDITSVMSTICYSCFRLNKVTTELGEMGGDTQSFAKDRTRWRNIEVLCATGDEEDE